MIPEWGTISLIEIFWTTFALIGIGFSLYANSDAKQDRSMLPPEDSTPELSAAHVSTNQVLRNERVRLFLQASFALIGFASMVLPQDNPISPPRLVLTFLLMSAPIAIAAATALDRRDRRKQLSLLSYDYGFETERGMAARHEKEHNTRLDETEEGDK